MFDVTVLSFPAQTKINGLILIFVMDEGPWPFNLSGTVRSSFQTGLYIFILSKK